MTNQSNNSKIFFYMAQSTHTLSERIKMMTFGGMNCNAMQNCQFWYTHPNKMCTIRKQRDPSNLARISHTHAIDNGLSVRVFAHCMSTWIQSHIAIYFCLLGYSFKQWYVTHFEVYTHAHSHVKWRFDKICTMYTLYTVSISPPARLIHKYCCCFYEFAIRSHSVAL